MEASRYEYSLTLFGHSKSYAIAALNGDERMPDWGWCQTKINDLGTVIEFRCMEPSKGPTCGTVFLQNDVTGQRNPERSVCRSDYLPYSGRFGADDIARFGVNLPFRDPAGLAHFPVDGPKLPQSRIIIRPYEPQDHSHARSSYRKLSSRIGKHGDQGSHRNYSGKHDQHVLVNAITGEVELLWLRR